ncbi:MAG: ATP-dependent DNA helicase RecG [Bifidobacteriaceae bacterium]|nr:ATP-dependent DNA helicase RecG [Bifidobacteriaceae bacterium]
MNQAGAAAAAGAASADAYLAARVGRVAGRAGRKLAQAGLATIGDLLRHFPKRYEDPRVPTDMAQLRLDEVATINARVGAVSSRRLQAQSRWLVTAVITDGVNQLSLTFFLGRPHLVEYYEREYRPGRMGLFTGRVSLYRGLLQLVHPEVLWEDRAAEPDPRFEGRLIPIYPAVAGVQSPALQRAIQTALACLDDDAPTDPLPGAVLAARGLPPLGRALWQIHNPAAPGEWAAARARFAFEEAFTLQVAFARRRERARREGGAVPRPAKLGADSLVAALDRRLPFELTAAQAAAGAKLSALLSAGAPMNQLLQGDVGSGKTVVALRAMLQVVDAGGQAALLAPTEVLAAQHFRTIRDLLGPLGRDVAGPGPGPEAGSAALALLTGSVAPKAKAALLADLAAGQIGLVVGTHALLEEAVQFKDLGLVVVDEQHRFGVEQRDALRARADGQAHLLVMTATPIPRTVAMTVFGDLGVTTLEAGPPGRPPVATTWVNPQTHPSWLPRVWQRLAEEVAAGRRAFVVCPAIEPGQLEAGAELVEEPPAEVGQLAFPSLPAAVPRPGEGEGRPAGPGRPLASVAQVLEQLRAEPALGGVRLAALHGRLSPAEKDRVMAAFSRGQIDLLVATTVIEVGIDIPEATALVVLDADRFGLAQLHQLRGRVGRGSDAAVCLLVSQAEPDSAAAARLKAMERTANGFELAEVDLETRREGQILGDTQSGASSLRLVRLSKDAALIADARAAAEQVVEEDPDLTRWPALRAAMERLLAGREAYLERG